MAKLTKTKRAKPLADTKLDLLTHENARGRVIKLLLRAGETPKGKSRYFRLECDRYEAINLACFIARHLTSSNDVYTAARFIDNRDDVKCLRDLASYLESRSSWIVTDEEASGRIVAFLWSREEAEAWIEARAKKEPEKVRRGGFGIKGPEDKAK